MTAFIAEAAAELKTEAGRTIVRRARAMGF
jgi:hypothetical protein